MKCEKNLLMEGQNRFQTHHRDKNDNRSIKINISTPESVHHIAHISLFCIALLDIKYKYEVLWFINKSGLLLFEFSVLLFTNVEREKI